MLQIIGLLVGVYTMARSFSAITSKDTGPESIFGRIGFVLCLLATIGLMVVLLTWHTPTTTP